MAAETFGGATVVIDLGLARGEPDEYHRPVGPTLPVWLAPALVAVLVLLSSVASASPPPAPLRPVLSLPVGPADAYTLTPEGDLIAQTYGTLSSYDLGSGELHWQAGSAAPSYRLRTASGLVLLRPWSSGRTEPGTTAVSLTSGAAQWRRTGTVVMVAGSTTLLAVSAVRSASGPGRRVQGAVDAINPAGGATRWQVRVPSTAVLLGVPGPAGSGSRMLLLHDNRTAAVHDLDTGALLTSAQLPAADYGPDNPTVSGGLLLLRHPTPTGRMVSAYDPVTLRQRWTRPAGYAFGVTGCGRLTCLTGPDGVRALDPATGDEHWFRPGWRGVEQRGDLVVAYGTQAGENDTVGVIDPETGAIVVDLAGWRPVPGAGPLLVTRPADAGGRSMVAFADPGSARPRLFADLPEGTGECQAVPERLVCRSSSGDLTVWAYHREG